MQQARLSDAGIAQSGDDLAMPGRDPLESLFKLLDFALPPDEFRQPSFCRELKMSAQRPQASNFVNAYRCTHASDWRRTERLEIKVAVAELPGLCSHCDRTDRRQRLHSRRQTDRMPDGRVFGMCPPRVQ